MTTTAMIPTYFKRYRMEIDLTRQEFAPVQMPVGYQAIRWDPAILNAHAEAKYLSFRDELDANVFSCLSNLSGCKWLMQRISSRGDFVPQATWLITRGGRPDEPVVYCGTIQGLGKPEGHGSIQNIAIIPAERGNGLGTRIIRLALAGFRRAGMTTAGLEVTARNEDAIRLYKRLGFGIVRTVFKVIELPYTSPSG